MALTDNLQAYWKLDESSGNAADATGNGYTLTNNNTVTYAAGKINNGAEFGSANTNKTLSTTALSGLTFTTPFTVSLWVKVETEPASSASITPWSWSNSSSASNNGAMRIQYYNNAGTYQLYINRGENGYSTNEQYGVNQTLTVGTWYFLTFVWDGSTETLYLNGSSIVSGASTITGVAGVSGDGTGTTIGKGSSSHSNEYWNGMVDEVGIWSRALSSSEITQLYNGGAGLQYPFSTLNSNFFAFM